MENEYYVSRKSVPWALNDPLPTVCSSGASAYVFKFLHPESYAAVSEEVDNLWLADRDNNESFLIFLYAYLQSNECAELLPIEHAISMLEISETTDFGESGDIVVTRVV